MVFKMLRLRVEVQVSTRVNLANHEDDGLRITLCSSGACLPHLEIAMGGPVEIGVEHVRALALALDALVEFATKDEHAYVSGDGWVRSRGRVICPRCLRDGGHEEGCGWTPKS